MSHTGKPLKIVYLTPALYMAGGVERVLSLKASYLAEQYGYDVTIILTEGKGKPLFYPLSDKIKVVNLNIGFEELWTCSFMAKVFVYLRKQRRYKKALTKELMRLCPDITVSLLRREINFINDIKDGSKKVGEMHINRANYRNFEANDTNILKELFARLWMRNFVRNLRRLDRFVVLTEEDSRSWPELGNIKVIPDPLSFPLSTVCHSQLTNKRVIAVGRYVYQKGFDLLLQAWAKIEKKYPDWHLDIFGDGNREPYEALATDLGIDSDRYTLHGPTNDIRQEYQNSSLFVFSSRFEGFGMVLVEAMACGLPVVSFACPCGPRDIVKDGEDGLLIENGHVDALVDGMMRLMGDDALRQQMAKAGAENVKRFSIENIVGQWHELFGQIVKS